jgi:hypothetical protein
VFRPDGGAGGVAVAGLPASSEAAAEQTISSTKRRLILLFLQVRKFKRTSSRHTILAAVEENSRAELWKISRGSGASGVASGSYVRV